MKEYTDLTTLRFILFEILDFEEVLAQNRFEDHDTESVNMFIDSVKDFSDKELYPYFREMDESPAHYKDGEIIVHSQVRETIKKAAELGLIAAAFDYDDGGLQLPHTLVNAVYWIQECANNHLPNYYGLTQAAANLITHFGNNTLRENYVSQMLSGKWTGTMCLTEPQAGSSLSDIRTTAYPEGEHYQIRGQKIFISGGDFQGAENVIHLLLARIEGAPAGVKGISLFVVPKKRPVQGEELTGNDVNTIGDFQKMGQKGYCTTHLSFGDNEDCRGWLVGEPHQGLKYMFMMMNEARIAVGRGAAAISMAAYRAALSYAKERPQGRSLGDSGKKNPEEQQVLIIKHPDVKRMLLQQKAITEASLCLVLLSAKYQDLSRVHPDPEERKRYGRLLDLLTPVTKTYPAEKGTEAVSQALQVFGGYGYCNDFIIQQYYRDIRIFSIYEGTTGIQSLDLLGRKVIMDEGKAVKELFLLVEKSSEKATEHADLAPYAGKLREASELCGKVIAYLTGFAREGKHERFLADATVFMKFFGIYVSSWLWLEMGMKAQQALDSDSTVYSKAFYRGKVLSMKYFYKYELPAMTSLAETLFHTDTTTLNDLDEEL
ncbi:acyl-CoA dehydrogenase [Robertkochia aurantiaca]|uniref:acyl-CoA dehydrogenase n=1 Tax=Robertkochia aurantiaca TaxID=2873700 RepID=UPI001CD01100|nr:acyl-CoA dehydrogenase [Robertkochia sp. 3YJGBD-33]